MNNVSFHGKPIIHDYYPVEETVYKVAEAAKKKAEAAKERVEAYTRFDGLNSEAKIKKIERPASGSNVHLKTKDLVEKELEAETKAAVDSVNSTAAGNAYEQFRTF